jgi:hypothetical protein
MEWKKIKKTKAWTGIPYFSGLAKGDFAGSKKIQTFR